MAAKFELEELNDVSAARVVIQQGLRANSNSKHLWLEVSLIIFITPKKVPKIAPPAQSFD